MKSKNNLKKESRMARFLHILPVKSVVLGTLILTGIQAPVQAQDAQYTKPSWYFGAAAGANVNFHRGSTHELNADFTPPTTFHDGQGVGLYVAPLIEFRPATSQWGVMLQAGYDSRKGTFDQTVTPCNCPADLNTDISYITVEPSLRFAPFKSNFYLYGGPRFAFNYSKGFNYQLGINPAFPDQDPTDGVSGDFSNVNSSVISMQIGAGLDIPLSSQSHRTQFVLSPFVSFQPYFGQDPRSIETWNVTTLRVGAALKLGRGHKIPAPEKKVLSEPVNVVVAEPKLEFAVVAPKNIQEEPQVREFFPLSNYIFFDLESTKISDRYVLLTREQVLSFKEDQVELSTPDNMSGRSKRQMTVYYNVLNILGDRMVKSPNSTIKLVGSSEQGPKDGKLMAESVKIYLVDVFGIASSRITVEGRTRPVIQSVQPGGTVDLVLLQEGDRRVSIETNSPALLMEFQSGPDAPLKPVEIVTGQEAPIESYITFNNEGAKDGLASWTLEITDENNNVQNFGPYYEDNVSLPSASILGTRPEGDYKIKMIGLTKDGKTVTKETSAHMVLWTPAETQEGTRFSVLYEFNRSKAIAMYENYLMNVVIPKIPQGGTVIIHGHADITGSEGYNVKLSLARANNVKNILTKGLKKAGTKDVTFEVYGLGEDEKSAPFENKYPEERFYNRTVIIDIVPQK